MRDFLPLCRQIAAENNLLQTPLVQASLDYLQRSVIDSELDVLIAAIKQFQEEKDELYFSLDPGCIHMRAKAPPEQFLASQAAFREARTLAAILDALHCMKEGGNLRFAWYELAFGTEDKVLHKQCLETFNHIQRTRTI